MLFEPFHLKKLKLRNRIVMAPMTRNMSPGGIPTIEVANYYKRRAKAEVGLIISEGIELSHKASSAYPNCPRLDTKKAREGWKRVVSGVKEEGGSMIAQLWHSGAIRKKGMDPDPEIPGFTPSGLTSPGKKKGYAMTKKDIDEVIEAYTQDALWCEEIGFDGVEIHGAHEYLIDNFFWEILNQREDDYGGSIIKRTKFATDIIKSIIGTVDKDFVVGLRFSQWKQQNYEAKLAYSPDELEQFLKPIQSSGIDFLHTSMRRYWEPEFEGSEENLASWTKSFSKLPTISVGSVGLDKDFQETTRWEEEAKASKPTSINKALSDVENGKYDLVAVGRALLADPEWVLKMKEGRMKDLVPYTKECMLELR